MDVLYIHILLKHITDHVLLIYRSFVSSYLNFSNRFDSSFICLMLQMFQMNKFCQLKWTSIDIRYSLNREQWTLYGEPVNWNAAWVLVLLQLAWYQDVSVAQWLNKLTSWVMPCIPMCILSTLSTLNSIENYNYHIEFRMDSMHIGTQAWCSCRWCHFLSSLYYGCRWNPIM